MLRISIFIDGFNALNSFISKYGEGSHLDFQSLQNSLLVSLKKNLEGDYGTAPLPKFRHQGTWLCVGLTPTRADKMDKIFLSADQKPGILLSAGMKDPNNYAESAVDTEIISLMLEGARNNLYDVAILASSDTDYIPVVKRIQDRYNKKVYQYQTHPTAGELTQTCYSRLVLESISACHSNHPLPLVEETPLRIQSFIDGSLLSKNGLSHTDIVSRLRSRIREFFGPQAIVLGSAYLTALPSEEEGKPKLGDLQALDKAHSVIFRPGHITPNGGRKAIDGEIVCQMLDGAAGDHYDLAVLVADHNNYLPAVRRIHEQYGKRVIYAGLAPNCLLRAECYARMDIDFLRYKGQ